MPIRYTQIHRISAEVSSGWQPGDLRVRIDFRYVAWPHYTAIAETGRGPVHNTAAYARRLQAAWPVYVRCHAHEYLQRYLDVDING